MPITSLEQNKPFLFAFQILCACDLVFTIFSLLSSFGTFFSSLNFLSIVDKTGCPYNTVFFLIFTVGVITLGEGLSLLIGFKVSVTEEEKKQKISQSLFITFLSTIAFVVRLAFLITVTSIGEGTCKVSSKKEMEDVHFFIICQWIFWSFTFFLTIPKFIVLIKAKRNYEALMKNQLQMGQEDEMDMNGNDLLLNQ
ncbi:hypothetical protein ABK040_002618 [Willaertia magna]